jgi:hypothetical protein
MKICPSDFHVSICVGRFEPFWGYRRIWAYLYFVEQRTVNMKRILGLMGSIIC